MKTLQMTLIALLLMSGLAWSQAAQNDGGAGHGHEGPSTGPTTREGGTMGGGMMGGMMGGGMMGGGMMGSMMRGPGMSGQGMHQMMAGEMMGSGMMGAAPGELALDAKIPPEKRDQIRDIHLSLAQALSVKSGELQSQRLALMKAVHAFPLDQAAAKTAREAMQRAMADMMTLRLDAMAKIQQVLGKELWEQAHPGWFGPRGMGTPPAR